MPAFRGLLQMPASLRATAEDCLAHPYLQTLEQANNAGQPAAALVRRLFTIGAAVQRSVCTFTGSYCCHELQGSWDSKSASCTQTG